MSLPFREEAQNVWEKREAEWEKERRARERLMREVNFKKSVFMFISAPIHHRKPLACESLLGSKTLSVWSDS